MPNLIDLVGKRFGRLLVMERAPNIKGRVRWSCLCDCGKEKPVLSLLLQNGRTRSCGCLKNEVSAARAKTDTMNRIKQGAAIRQLFSNYKCGARKRVLVWGLSLEEFKTLTSSPCYYTATAPSSIKKAKSGETYVYNGIDRLNNDEGYTPNNCVPCCSEINRMKGQLTVGEFIELCHAVIKRSFYAAVA